MLLSRRLGLEQLENRDLMAGVVRVTTATNGDVVIRGDNNANAITIVQTSGTTYKVTGNAGSATSILGTATFNAANKLSIILNGGNDLLTIGEVTKDTAVPANLAVNTGAGADRVTTYRAQGVNAVLTLGGETENDVDVMNMRQSTFTGVVTINLGGGNDQSNTNKSEGRNGFNLNGGAGNDQFNFAESILGSPNIQGGDGIDKIHFSSGPATGRPMTIRGTFLANGGNGVDSADENAGTVYDLTGLDASSHPSFENWGASF